MRVYCVVVAAAALASCSGPERVSARVRLTMDGPAPVAVVAPRDIGAGAGESASRAGACGLGTTRCTPRNLAGRIFSAGVLWGRPGPGASMIDLLAPPAGKGGPGRGGDGWDGALGGTQEFSLVDATMVATGYEVPDEDGEPRRPIERVELQFDFLDASLAFEPGSGPLAGRSFVVRTVFAESAEAGDTAGTMRRGDKLLRADGETSFRWCNASGCATERAAVEDGLVREAKLVGYERPGQGNPNYVPFVVPLVPQVEISHERLATEGNTWSVSFDMTHAVVFRESPAQLTGDAALLDAFELSYEPAKGQGTGERTEISARLTVEGR